MKINKHSFRAKIRPALRSASFLAILGGLLFSSCGTVFAAGTAKLTLEASSGTHKQNSTLVTSVYETSTEEVNAVEADLSYDKTKLQFQGLAIADTFDLNIPNTNGNGTIKISASKTGTGGLTGKQLVATVNFKVLASSGTTTISFIRGTNKSQIVRISDHTNIWDGVTTGGTYTLTDANGNSTGSNTTTTGTTKTSSSTPTNSTNTKSTSNNKTTKLSSTVVSYFVAVKVKDTNGFPVKSATVTLDGSNALSYDNSGIASFSNVTEGQHTVTAKSGSNSVDQNINVVAGKPQTVQQFEVTLPVTKKKSDSSMVLWTVLATAALLGLLTALLKLKGKKQPLSFGRTTASDDNITAATTSYTTTQPPQATTPNDPTNSTGGNQKGL